MNNYLIIILYLFSTLLFSASFAAGSLSHTASPEESVKWQSQYQQMQNVLQANSKELIRQLKEGEVVGLEILIAGPSGKKLMSRFGHALFRFVSHPQGHENWMDDPVLSVVANINEPHLSYLKGVIGGYTPIAEIKDFYSFWLQYVLSENRPLERFIVPINSIILNNLTTVLENFINNPAQHGDYTFFSSNCASLLSELLIASGLAQGTGTIIPTNVGDYFKYHYAAPYPHLVVTTPYQTFTKTAQLLKLKSNHELLQQDLWNEDNLLLLTEHLSDLEMKQLMQTFKTLINHKIYKRLAKKYNFAQGATLDEVMAVTNVPTSLYTLCSTKICAHELLLALNTHYGTKEFHKFMRYLTQRVIAERSTDHREQYKKKFRAQKIYRNHVQLLTEAYLQMIRIKQQ